MRNTENLFLFLTYFNNISILTRYGFNLRSVARLVAPASVAPLRLARQGRHAGGPTRRCATLALTWASLSRHMQWRDKACRAMRVGATRPMHWACARPFSPTLPFFPPPPRPEQRQGRRHQPPPPRSPKIHHLGGQWGKTFPNLPRRYCPYYLFV